MAAYTKLGLYTVVPAADLISLTSAINVKGPARVANDSGDRLKEGVGKHAGMLVMRDSGTGDKYSLVFATGPLPADVWLAVDGVTKYTPV